MDVLHALIRSHSLATLVVPDPVAGGELGVAVEHIPMLLSDEGSFGVLRGHVARANPVWRALADAKSCMLVFQGPGSYVSPAWYPSKAEHGKVVPTWNYAVVHVVGTPRVVEDAAWLRRHVGDLTVTHEATRLAATTRGAAPPAWRVSDAPDDFIAGMLRAIVGVEIPIARMQGKYKLSQNRAQGDQVSVVRGLLELDSADARETAQFMERRGSDE